jgi:hypothetical protein
MVLDIGCGKHKQEPDAVGLDRSPDSDADIVCDLSRFPWPLGDHLASKIYLSHIVEHIPDLMGAMAEVYRIAQPGAKVFIVTPHFSSHNSYVDPTHCHHLACASFEYFTGAAFERFSSVPFRFRILECKLSFGHNFVLDGIGRFIAGRSLPWYERHAAWIFPAQDIFCVLEAVK